MTAGKTQVWLVKLWLARFHLTPWLPWTLPGTLKKTSIVYLVCAIKCVCFSPQGYKEFPLCFRHTCDDWALHCTILPIVNESMFWPGRKDTNHTLTDVNFAAGPEIISGFVIVLSRRHIFQFHITLHSRDHQNHTETLGGSSVHLLYRTQLKAALWTF